ncbi:UTRA domain-containing protein [Streptomyces sp. NBC_01433]|uniref:UTRA domain-containing protein n=1 Tax=Streptomyces sp. NBC_01433 TaxID=2903864 RepID=UPI002258E6DA|nr:UTRA domain-containing protein [Streptomyces sp. NBC_01433]MCX4682080.1 UTRA domain-containing protein [Streptomyces sp. NBC_01433]
MKNAIAERRHTDQVEAPPRGALEHRRQPVARSNARHAWEKARVRQPLAERRATGATERDTGLQKPELSFSAEYREIESPSHVATNFGVPSGTLVLERNYRTRYLAEPHSLGIVRSYLLRNDIAANPALLDSTNEPWPGGTQSQLETVGIEFERITERVTARAANAEESVELGLREHEPVLVLEKVARDTAGIVVEVAHIVLPADRTTLEFVTPLDRW